MGARRSAFDRLGMTAAAIAASAPLEAQAASQPGISVEESIPERQPDNEAATFAASAQASQASEAALPPPVALDLSQGDEWAA